ncbi:MAG: PAS domain-containing sensor histidine kinase [Patescibacteria group bacterium]
MPSEQLTKNNLKQQIEYFKQVELAMMNILEDERELEINLKNERDKTMTIVSSVGEGLLVIDNDYKIVLINEIAARFLEVSVAGVIGKDAKEIINMYKGSEKLPDEKRPVAKTLKTGKIVTIRLDDDIYYIVSSGRRFPITLISTPLVSKGNIVGAVVVFSDITEEKKLDEAKSSFIATASHQLRTPLTTIRWYSEMLSNGDAGPLNKDQKVFMEKIYNGILKLNEALGILLSLARIEGGGNVKINPVKTNLVKFTDEIIKSLALLAKEKKINIKINAVEKDLPEVLIDQAMLSQVIVNLLSNAIRYTDNKGKIEISIAVFGNSVIYSIKDDGIGIPQGQQKNIFNKFFRAENAISKIPDGNGIGLTLVKNFVEFWKGKIWFESPTVWIGKKGGEERKGTIFYLTIPI